MAKTGAHGWPLVPSTAFPGELTLACPKCHRTSDVVLSVAYPVRGTGPSGRGRLGDPGSTEYAKCTACGYDSRYPNKRV